MIVVIAFIEKNEQILITQRAPDTYFGGFWELPGGKLENLESPSSALMREMKEELGIELIRADFLCKISQGSIEFYLYHVINFQKEPMLLAGQTGLAWVNIDEIHQYVFPPTNQLFFDIWKNYKREIPN